MLVPDSKNWASGRPEVPRGCGKAEKVQMSQSMGGWFPQLLWTKAELGRSSGRSSALDSHSCSQEVRRKGGWGICSYRAVCCVTLVSGRQCDPEQQRGAIFLVVHTAERGSVVEVRVHANPESRQL